MTADSAGDAAGASPWRLGYRAELDGVRGLAILIVLADHLAVPGFEGTGKIGVMVFFVLSGFLITRLLVEERERTGRNDLRGFYVRRIRRLAPALAVALAAVVAIEVLSGRAAGAPLIVVSVVAYVGNWVVALGGDLSLMKHSWSLAIEEQYYLVWPTLFILAATTRPKVTVVALFTLAGASAFLRSVAPYPFSHHATITMLDGILVGSALGFLIPRFPPHHAFVAMGLTSLALSIALVERGGINLAFATVAGAALTIAAVHGSRLFSLRWLVALGTVSYGVYLWNSIVFGAFDLDNPVAPPLLRFAGLVLTLVIAAASSRWVERPFRAATKDASRASHPTYRSVSRDREAVESTLDARFADDLRVDRPSVGQPEPERA